ncbi:murein biosynthesis integral membrane protein MurJ [Aliiruegeria sabulilitoris]|uniref:murein biosynthesis integral membrane protein MurJ n=1 Tax=Aliiruegeria sabulilitoris TaxID=1510458 RepID=UPI000AEE7B55|nr:murein biosynthesis integral membrane protein MurJ [Aliiruegeria sabulilitoris]
MSPPRWVRSLGLVSGLTVVSRILGFVRDVVMAQTLGTGPVAVGFMLAFRLSNQLRAFLAEGAFTIAFQPIDAAMDDGSEKARRFRAETLGWLWLGNAVLLVAALAAPGPILSVLAPGYGPQDPVHSIAQDLLRITFPYLACLSTMAFLGARLATKGRFAAMALAPSLMNLCLIAGLLLAGGNEHAGHVAAVAVLVSGVAQVGLVWWACRRAGIAFVRPRLGASPATRRFFAALWPAILSAGALQLAVFIDTIFASFLPSGTLGHLYYADRLYQLPMGILSVALGTVLLPEISGRIARGDSRGPRRILFKSLLICAAIGLPAALAMALLGDEAIALLFQRGNFTAADTEAAATILAGYAWGVVPALLVRPLAVGFQARGDTATPMRLLLVSLVANLGCKAATLTTLGAFGLALGTSVGLAVYCLLLAIFAVRRGHFD